MDSVSYNKVQNVLNIYGIIENQENFGKIAAVIDQRDYYVYREILKIVENCRIIHDDNTGLTVEIDLDIHKKLLDDIGNRFFIKKIRTRKVETRNQVISNTFLTLKIWKTYWKKKRYKY